MREESSQYLLKTALAMAGVLLLAGCFATLPENGRLAEVHEAYPDDASMVPPVDNHYAYEQVVLRAPYAVVYRSALESASEIMQIVSNDKERGVILGTAQGPKEEWGTARVGMNRSMYYIAVRLSEKGPKRIELLTMVKAQAECTYGILQRNDCIGVSRVQWLGEHEGDLNVMLRDRISLTRFVTAVRAKVIRAGYE